MNDLGIKSTRWCHRPKQPQTVKPFSGESLRKYTPQIRIFAHHIVSHGLTDGLRIEVMTPFLLEAKTPESKHETLSPKYAASSVMKQERWNENPGGHLQSTIQKPVCGNSTATTYLPRPVCGNSTASTHHPRPVCGAGTADWDAVVQLVYTLLSGNQHSFLFFSLNHWLPLPEYCPTGLSLQCGLWFAGLCVPCCLSLHQKRNWPWRAENN